MDYKNENTGYGNEIQILLGAVIISIASYVFLQNPLLYLGFVLLVYLSPIGFMALILYLFGLYCLMTFVQAKLRKARQQKGHDSTQYRDVLFFLMILPVLGAFTGLAHLGFFYSLTMLAWSFFAIIREK